MAKAENQTTAQQYTLRQGVHRSPEGQTSAWDAQVAATPQRTLGNQALARRSNAAGTLRTQAKLTVGPAVDHYEREADSVAAQVVQNIQTQQGAQSANAQRQGGAVQRHGGEEDEVQMQRVSISTLQREADEEELQAKRIGASAIQREEEEELQAKRVNASTLQREADEEEELQAKRVDASTLQREEEEDEMEAQGKRDPAGGALGGEVTNEVESAIRSQRGGGNAMPKPHAAQWSPALAQISAACAYTRARRPIPSTVPCRQRRSLRAATSSSAAVNMTRAASRDSSCWRTN